ncbi:MAG: hypothetical protein JSS09_08760, partial [Verrucomicrobia bacterium]|nr:hypothetical protein [Verrucomicrobiota bacterium]
MNPIKSTQHIDLKAKDSTDKNRKTLYPLFATAVMAAITALGRGKKFRITSISGLFTGSSFLFQRSFCLEKEKKDQKFLFPLFPLIPLDDPFRLQVDEKLIGHELDFLIKGTSLEGSNIEKNAKHLNAFTKLCSEKGTISSTTSQKLEDFFANMEHIPKDQISFTRKRLAAYLANKVSYLEPEKSFSMSGGWIEKDVGGHALLYVFTRKLDDLYDVYVYNTGLGIDQYHAKLEVEEGIKKKTLICPYMKIENVIPSKLSNPILFEKLIEIEQGLMNENPLDCIYNAFKTLGKVSTSGPDTFYITPQRSGTCSFKVLLAAIRPLFESEEEYKRYKFSLKYTDFLVFFENNQFSLLGKAFAFMKGVEDPLQDNPSARELLLRQGEKLLRSLEKLQDLFSEEEVKETQDKILTILAKLDSKQKIDSPLTCVEPVKDRTGIGNAHLYSQYIGQIVTGNPSISKIPFKDILIDPLSLNNIKDHLTKIGQTKDTSVAVYATEKLAEELLKFSKEDFAKISKKEIAEIIDSLHRVFLRYMNIQHRGFLGESQVSRNTAWAFILKTHELASFLVPALMKFRMPYEILSEEAVNELYIEYSKKEFDKLMQIFDSFERDKEKQKIFDLYQYTCFGLGLPFPPEEELLKSLATPQWSIMSFLTGSTHDPKPWDLKSRVELLIKKDRLT